MEYRKKKKGKRRKVNPKRLNGVGIVKIEVRRKKEKEMNTKIGKNGIQKDNKQKKRGNMVIKNGKMR